jgi:hypothetical protein
MGQFTASTQDQLAEDERKALFFYDRDIHPGLRPEDDNKFVAIACTTGDYEIDKSDFRAVDRLTKRRPEERIWMMRAGRRAAYKFAGASDILN